MQMSASQHMRHLRLALLHDFRGKMPHANTLPLVTSQLAEMTSLTFASSAASMRSLWTVELRAPEAKSAGSSPRSRERAGAHSGRRGRAARQRDAHGRGLGELDQEVALWRRVRGQHAATRAARMVRATVTSRTRLDSPVLNSCSKRRLMLKPRNTFPAAFTTRQ